MSDAFDFNRLNQMLGDLAEGMNQMKEDASKLEVEGKSGGGLVSAVANGEQEILKVRIADDAMGDRELLEDLVAAAVNDALRQAREAMASRVSQITGRLPLPPGVL